MTGSLAAGQLREALVTLDLIVGLIAFVIGCLIFSNLVESAVRKGVREALRDHHEWLHDPGHRED